MPDMYFVPTQFLSQKQAEDLLSIFKKNQPTPHKAMLAYIEEQPDLMIKLKQGVSGTELLPAYYAYALELQILESRA